MRDKNDPTIHAYVCLIRTAESLHAQVSRGLLVEGISASQFSAMKALHAHGKLSQRDIAKHILKSGGNITLIVDNLEKLGYVTRERDTEDRRIIYVSLTPEGQSVFDSVYPEHLERINDAMGNLTEAECHQLVALLDKTGVKIEHPDCLEVPSQTK